MVTKKAVFTGVFSTVLSVITLFFLLKNVGGTGNDDLDAMLLYFPFVIGAAIGFYVGKFLSKVSDGAH
ncbi:hypothetical protein [Motilimonas eburnea]|uniref:hypothetical protein n=1 Tax=Motilimonas eburnea TaxID=1737488 RepID=UPI001E598B3A|nr:hypothetical protein [Motilimonas eburnea]MCE2571842.1 hypothetical protein [Motilimonas eburnea]